MYHFRDLTVATTSAPAQFSVEEALVLQVAAHDGIASVRTPGRLARLIARMFAVRRAAPLANARLEALRRAAILSRIEGRIPAGDVETLLGFGFSAAQLATLGAR